MTSSTVPPIRWAVLGPDSIARRFASQLSTRAPDAAWSPSAAPTPAAGRPVRRRAGAGRGRSAGSYDEILADTDVDAVYVATVHTTHARLAIAALEAGKHVLCEKPLAPTTPSVMAMADVARVTRPGAGRGVHVPLPPADPTRCWS